MPGGAHEHMKAWDPEEDHIIIEMVQSLGPKWKSIINRLPGRTVSSVRNRYQRIEKGRKLREEGSELIKNRCHACGKPKRGHICYAKMRGGPQVELSPRLTASNPPALTLTGGGNTTLTTTVVASAVPAQRACLPTPPDTFQLWPDAPSYSAPEFDVPANNNLSLGADAEEASFVVTEGVHRVVPAQVQQAPPILARSNSSLFKDFVNNPDIISRQPSMNNGSTPALPQLGCSVSSFVRDFIDTSATLTLAPTA